MDDGVYKFKYMTITQMIFKIRKKKQIKTQATASYVILWCYHELIIERGWHGLICIKCVDLLFATVFYFHQQWNNSETYCDDQLLVASKHFCKQNLFCRSFSQVYNQFIHVNHGFDFQKTNYFHFKQTSMHYMCLINISLYFFCSWKMTNFITLIFLFHWHTLPLQPPPPPPQKMTK